MKFVIYKTTNMVNNKIYIGKHQTKDIDDGYLGSGSYLNRAIEKYGKDKFKREILFECNSLEEMNDLEANIVDELFVARLDTYNIELGGLGDWSHINNNPELKAKLMEEARATFRKKLIDDQVYYEAFCKKQSASRLLFFENGGIDSFIGKKHTEKSKRKIGEANSKHQSGEGNSMYGTCWIYNEVLRECKRVPKDDINMWLYGGWKKGRKMKF